MAPLPNRVHPLAGSYWVVACNELRDIEEVCFSVLGKRRLGSCPVGPLDRRDAFVGLGEDHFGSHNAALIELNESLAHGAPQRFLSLQET